jgi:AcrR family transcriptional regulator
MTVTTTDGNVATTRKPNIERRNPNSHSAIIKAKLDLLERVRYSSLTIEAIAAEAGVGKATVYRWWPSKGALVAEAMTSMLVVEDPPELGDIRNDLIAAVEISIANYLRPPSGVLVHALASDIADDPVLLESFRNSFIHPRRNVVARLLHKGIEDGRLPPSPDPDLVMDMWAGALFYRGLFKHVPLENDLAAQLVDGVFGTFWQKQQKQAKKRVP